MKMFAYGMNTNLDEMAYRCPGAVSLGLAWIDDYRLVFRSHADIEYSPGDRCYGVLWEIDEKHLKSLDALEGYPYYYTRFEVTAHTAKNGRYQVPTLVYQMNDRSYMQEPGSGYLNLVTEGYIQNEVPTIQINDAINMVCSLSTATKMDSHTTWSPMTRDFA